MAARSAFRTSLALAATLIVSPDLDAGAQPPQPLPAGNRIVAQDGDVIVLEGGARARIVRRHEAMVRIVFDPAERWLVLVADFADAIGKPDGRVDRAYHYRNISGDWPMEERWQGVTTIEESSIFPGGSGASLSVAGPRGVIQLISRGTRDYVVDATATAVLFYAGGGSSTNSGASFDAAEQERIAELRKAWPEVPPGSPSAGNVTTSLTLSVEPAAPRALPDNAVRVGGSIPPPRKTLNVRPVVPERGINAGVEGSVALEITIDTDGSVKDARVLRPGNAVLDRAAVDAVRQWRYEPTIVDGQPRPVVMTVMVMFP